MNEENQSKRNMISVVCKLAEGVRVGRVLLVSCTLKVLLNSIAQCRHALWCWA